VEPTVSERALATETLFCLERLKAVVEPSGVLGLAGLTDLAEREPEAVRGKRVGVIISGGNLDPGRLPEILKLAGR